MPNPYPANAVGEAAGERVTATLETPISQPSGWFLYALWAITLGSLVPLVVLGRSEFISYDGYWHLFIDSQDHWRLFMSEYRGDAHPLLYHLVLRVLSRLGHSHLLYRSASILPGAGCVFVLGLTARKLSISPVTALLGAAAYGFSMVTIEIDIDVRSYALALFFVVAAFYYLVCFMLGDREQKRGREIVAWSVFSGLAIATEYYALFFWLGCLAALGFLLAANTVFRESILRWETDNRALWLGAFGFPFAVLAFFYRTHIRYQPHSYGHLTEYYWNPGVSRVEFILRNLRSDLNYLSPLPVSSDRLLVAALCVSVPLFLYLGPLRSRSMRAIAAGVPALLVVAILTEMMCAALLGRYPFGGFERQQSIFFPFLILTAFLLLDWAVAHIAGRLVRASAFALAALAITANFTHGWRGRQSFPVELATKEYQILEPKLASAPAVFVDQFTLIGFYIHTYKWNWTFRGHFREPDRVDEYTLADAGNQPAASRKLVLLRDIDEWNFDLHKPGVYQVLRHSLESVNLTSANMYLLKQVNGSSNAAGLVAEQDQVRVLAGAAGLTVRNIYDTNTMAVITFDMAAK